MLDPQTLEKLENNLEKIREKSDEGAGILVEGKNDEEALRELGIEGPIHQIPAKGEPLLNSIENLPEYDEVLVLTDFDRTGEKLAVFCRNQLEKLGVNVLSELRKKLKKFVRKGVKDIEGMSSFIQSERASKIKGN